MVLEKVTGGIRMSVENISDMVEEEMDVAQGVIDNTVGFKPVHAIIGGVTETVGNVADTVKRQAEIAKDLTGR